ncbi:MAG: hypothetical protein HYV97_18305 [Bdellovibrio sp.]|nr:hypothetical protein [Bdellovibrio sp.]
MKEHDTAFIKVSLKGDSRIHYLKLPMSMGGKGCDVILHSRPSTTPEFHLQIHQGKLVARYQKTGLAVDLQFFTCMGVLIEGPFFKTPPKKDDYKTKVQLRQKFSLSRKVRIILLASFLSLIFAGVIVALKQKLRSPSPELSQIPIILEEGVLQQKPFGYTPMIAGHQSAIHFQWSTKNQNVPYLFSFFAGSLDINHELLVAINSRVIYQYSLDINCIESFCPIEIIIPAAYLQKKINRLSVLHKQKESFYLIKDILLTPLPSASEDEQVEIQRKKELARSYFKDRHISYANLMSAHSQIIPALELVKKRQVPEELQIEVKILAKNIEDQLHQTIQKLENEMTNQLKLQLHHEAIKSGEQLIRLYAESDYIKRNRLIALMARLKMKKI